jgi:hypothetical protein
MYMVLPSVSRCFPLFFIFITFIVLILFPYACPVFNTWLEWAMGSVIGIATGYRLNNWGVKSLSPGRVKNFKFFISSRPALGSTQPPIQWVLGVKRQGREADHSLLTSAEVKKTWIYTSTLQYVFMVWCLIS